MRYNYSKLTYNPLEEERTGSSQKLHRASPSMRSFGGVPQYAPSSMLLVCNGRCPHEPLCNTRHVLNMKHVVCHWRTVALGPTCHYAPWGTILAGATRFTSAPILVVILLIYWIYKIFIKPSKLCLHLPTSKDLMFVTSRSIYIAS